MIDFVFDSVNDTLSFLHYREYACLCDVTEIEAGRFDVANSWKAELFSLVNDIVWVFCFVLICDTSETFTNMGLTISGLFNKLFGKKQMRILMGEFYFLSNVWSYAVSLSTFSVERPQSYWL